MKELTGINIQFPISQLILSGEKTVETRTYPMPSRYLGQEIAIIETPGGDGDFKARIVGIVVFSKCFRYRSKVEFYSDVARHHVSDDSPWRWKDKKPKWGWEIGKILRLKTPVVAPKKKGIVYTRGILLRRPAFESPNRSHSPNVRRS